MKVTAVLPVLILASIALGLVQCVMSNNLSDAGKRVHAMERDIAAIRQENIALEVEIASGSSVLAVRERAAAMGFTDKKTVISVRDTGAVALGTTAR